MIKKPNGKMVNLAYLIQVAEFSLFLFLKTPQNCNIDFCFCLQESWFMLELGIDLFGSGCNRTRDLCFRAAKNLHILDDFHHGSLSGVVFPPLWRPGSAGQAQHGEFCWKPSYTTTQRRS